MPFFVMAGLDRLDPAIHVTPPLRHFDWPEAWMPGTSSGMTLEMICRLTDYLGIAQCKTDGNG